MELNLNLEELVEKEIERQVKEVVTSKVSTLTDKRLKNMGYDIKELIEQSVTKHVQWYLEASAQDLIKEVGQRAVIDRSAELISSVMIERMEYDGR